jgi:hypothetical protein
MIATLFHILFAWPQGIVVGNLIASALWAGPVFLHLHWLSARRHRELMRAHRATHAKADHIEANTNAVLPHSGGSVI